uniref:Uncharacterized protein n=1 Tax=Marmota marmota marmota TaxID=9994 RepID=A0A8C6A472_MARMA
MIKLALCFILDINALYTALNYQIMDLLKKKNPEYHCMNFYLLMVISCIKMDNFEVCQNLKSEF